MSTDSTEVIILPSVDGDPGENFPQRDPDSTDLTPTGEQTEAYREAVCEMMNIFDAEGLSGRATWFVNETDVKWSSVYVDLLKEFVERGDTVGLHIHHHGLFRSPVLRDRREVTEAGGEALEALEASCGRRCECFRNGCYYQAEHVYEAVRDLGFEALSDVFPGYSGPTKCGFRLENAAVPRSARPWRHDSQNWTDHESVSGSFLHIPVHCGCIGDLEAMVDRVEEHHIPVVCWGIHPHELQSPDGSVSSGNCAMLSEAIGLMRERLAPRFMSLDEYRRQRG